MVGLANAFNISSLGLIFVDSEGNFHNVPDAAESGQVLISGSPGTIPSWGANVPSTPVIEVTSGPVSLVPNTIYIANSASQIQFTLPLSAAVGTFFEILGKGSGGWTIAQGTGQQLIVGNVSTTSGTGGSLSSNDPTDSVSFYCVTADTLWQTDRSPQSSGLVLDTGVSNGLNNLIYLIDNNLFAGFSVGNLTLTGGQNFAFGQHALAGLTTGTNNLAFGNHTLQFLTDGTDNIGVGVLALDVSIGGSYNIAIGTGCLEGLNESSSDGTQNIALGYQSLNVLTSGATNISIGFQSGLNYTGSESSNILLGSNGILGDSNICRIGQSGGEGGINLFALYMNSNVSVGENTFNAGITKNFASGTGNSFSSGSQYSSAIGNSNQIIACSYSLGIGSQNILDGPTSGFCQGNSNTIGVSAPSAILSGAGCTVTAGGNYCAIISSISSITSAASNNSLVLVGNTITVDGNNSIASGSMNVSGSGSFGFGNGSLTGDGTVAFTDANGPYSIASLGNQFYATFAGGINLNTLFIDSSGSITMPAAQNVEVTPLNDATWTVASNDYYIACDSGGGGNAIAITFPVASGSGRTIVVKDQTGTSSTYPITISNGTDTFDGQSSVTINIPYQSITFTDTLNESGDLYFTWSLS